MAGLVLVMNAGSSSVKARVVDNADQPLWSGQVEWQPTLDGPGDDAAMALVQEWLLPAIEPWSAQVSLVGHRVVHGGTTFTAPTALTPEVRRSLEALVPLAPLHNGPALAVIDALAHWRPALPQWACFDTAFHHTLPPEAFTYAIPEAWRQQGLRRFGFHGLNHQHVSQEVARRWAANANPRASGGFGAAAEPLRLISCHLGAGCSLCAIRDGISIDTTMGFTPLEGLVMATRSGSVDPGLLLHLLRHGKDWEELDRDLHQRSGLLGLSGGLGGSMKVLREAATAGHGEAALAIAVFRQALLRAIGAMAASLGGVDVIALTGGIGEHDAALREELTASLAWWPEVAWMVIAADEEGSIARQCRAAATGPADAVA
jgi:acetate kinase